MGIVGTHPGSFRKSGRQKTYTIRNLEECTENGSYLDRCVCESVNGTGANILKELEGPRGGGAWLNRAGKNLADPTKPI